MVPLGESHTAGKTRLNHRLINIVVWGRTRRLTLLQLELLNTGLIGSDGGTLDTNGILLDSLCAVDGNLVVGLVTVFNTLGMGSAGCPLAERYHPGLLPSRST